MNLINSGTVLINVSDWRMPVFAIDYSLLPQLGDRLVLRHLRFVGNFVNIYHQIKNANVILFGNRSSSHTMKSWSAHFLSANQAQCEIQLIGGDASVPNKWRVRGRQSIPMIERNAELTFWPLRVATFLPNVNSIKPVGLRFPSTDMDYLIHSVRSLTPHASGIASMSGGKTRAWLLGSIRTRNSCELRASASDPTESMKEVTIGAYIRGIFAQAYASRDSIAFTRAVLYRLTKKSQTEDAIREVSGAKTQNPYGLSRHSTALLGHDLIDQGLEEVEMHYRSQGWRAILLSRSGHLLAQDISGRVWTGQKVFRENLHLREISQAVQAELMEQNS